MNENGREKESKMSKRMVIVAVIVAVAYLRLEFISIFFFIERKLLINIFLTLQLHKSLIDCLNQTS